MKIIFLGTPDFATPTLSTLIGSGKNVAAVITQPDKPAGRGKFLKPPPVKNLAEKEKIPCHQLKSLKKIESQKIISEMMPDIGIVVAYGKIIPKEVLDIPKYGFINVHPSLLPKYRGASPIQGAIINGEKETGVTVMQLDEGLDTGDILRQKRVEISPNDTAETMHDKLAKIGAEMILETLNLLDKKKLCPVKQDHSMATYTRILEKKDGEIDWTKSAREIYNFIRGVYSWPGAYTFIRGHYIKIFPLKRYKEALTENNEPGKVLGVFHGCLRIQCGSGFVDISEVQLEGKKRLSISEFIKGFKLNISEILGIKHLK